MERVVLNLTPHPIVVGERTFPPLRPSARAVAPDDPMLRPDKAAEVGVPVIQPYEYTEFEGLPREETKKPGCAVIVSQIAADWLRALGPFGQKSYLGLGASLYVPDTDKGAVRDARGAIAGTTRLIFQFETPGV